MDGGWISEGRLREYSADSMVHTIGMGREATGWWVNRHPKGAADSLHYRLLAPRRLIHQWMAIPVVTSAAEMS